MNWKPLYNSDSCDKWIDNLKKKNFIGSSENTSHLISPFSIKINNRIHNKIKKIYVPYEEKGGLMFASLSKIKGEYILTIRSIYEIKNDVEKYFENCTKEHYYFPNIETYTNLLTLNFSKTDYKKILIPINFHTHPTDSTEQDIYYFDEVIHQLNTSDGDKKCAAQWRIIFNSFNLLFFNAIITGNSLEHRIIFYGYKVTPLNFSKFKSEQIANSAKDFIDGLESDGWRIASGIGILGLSLLAAFVAPKAFLYLKDEIVHSLDKKEFWSKLEDETTIIKIPLRDITDLE